MLLALAKLLFFDGVVNWNVSVELFDAALLKEDFLGPILVPGPFKNSLVLPKAH